MTASSAARDLRAGPATTDPSQLTSVITSGLLILGDVKSSGAIQVEGVIKGDVDCARITIQQGGVVEGAIRAEEVVIHGRATGAILGRKVMLHITAQVEADIRHQGIGIEMGTRYTGKLTWVDDSAFGPPPNIQALAAETGPSGLPS